MISESLIAENGNCPSRFFQPWLSVVVFESNEMFPRGTLIRENYKRQIQEERCEIRPNCRRLPSPTNSNKREHMTTREYIHVIYRIRLWPRRLAFPVFQKRPVYGHEKAQVVMGDDEVGQSHGMQNNYDLGCVLKVMSGAPYLEQFRTLVCHNTRPSP